ncbi:hypothetical protein ACVTMO_16920 [Pseudomonas segetis]
MSKDILRCYTCAAHIGYVYSSMPVHPINCIQCGDGEEDDRDDEDEEPCSFCLCRGCNGECSGDGQMGD